MAKPSKVRFEADLEELEGDKDDKNTRFKEKHSLDSDEEDDGKKYDVLADDDIEGQEDATIDFDETIQITPFNMKEEMEEGHFDTDGTYIFDKTKEIHDSWIDNIDWVKVKHKEEGEQTDKTKRPFQYSDDDDDDDDEEDDEARKKTSLKLYQEILDMLQPGETISAAIRRLSKNKAKIPSASQKWKNKKLKAAGKTPEISEAEIEQAREDQKQMLHLTELADGLVQQGIMDIYETSHQRLAVTLRQLVHTDKTSRQTIAEGMKDDDALDMFADDFDTKELDQKSQTAADTTSTADNGVFKVPGQPANPQPATPTSSSSSPSSSSSVMWEYKDADTEESEVKGPFTSSQMQAWSEDGTLGKGILCRKLGSTGQFYSSARIDFDLYD